MNRVGASKPSVAELAGARMPADHGLNSLGLLMQLGGTVFLVVYVYLALFPLILGGGAVGNETMWWFLFAAAGAIRSAFHRSAGRAMVYGSPSGPLGPTRLYIGVSAVHTVIAAIAIHKLSAPMAEWDESSSAPILPLIAACVAWPVTLLVITSRERFSRFKDTVLPTSEDLGFEGVAILMTLLGAVGMLLTMLMLVSIVQAAGSPLASGFVFFSVMVMVMLLIRSFLHVKAGIVGIGGADPHTFHDRAQSYYNFGVVSAILTGGGMLLISMRAVFHPAGFLPLGMTVYLLLIWPLMLKKYFTERNFEVLMAGEEAPALRRAPDTGLTALGWLLIATSVTALATKLASVVAPPGGVGNELLLIVVTLTGQVGPDGLERWLPIAMVALQLWAGLELIGMTNRHRVAANVFGAFGVIATVILHWDVFKSFGALGNAIGGTGSNPFGGALEVFLPLGAALAIPVGTLLLANRQNVAAARVVRREQ